MSLCNRRLEHFDQNSDETANPFAALLHRQRDETGAPASIEAISKHQAAYTVCADFARTLAGGHEDLADAILDGSIPLHDCPSLLLRREALDGRVGWFRQKLEEHWRRVDDELGDLDLGIDAPAGQTAGGAA